jgi:hypothetical protein
VVLEQRFVPLTVTTLQDDAPGSLRQAVVNTLWGGTILIDPHLKGTLYLNRQLVISRNVTIRGAGINQVVIRGKRDLPGGLIEIQSLATVTISQLTFSDPTPGLGSIIQNEGTLTLEECQLIGNTQKGVPAQFITNVTPFSAAGGAISNFGGTLILNKSLIAHNTVVATTGWIVGGGIFSSGPLIVNDSQIVDNTLIGNDRFVLGGGIFTDQSQLTLINSTIARNRVTGASLISDGGGIHCQQSQLTIKESTISDNSVQGGKQGYSAGGGIMNVGGTVSIDHGFLEGNTVESHTTTGNTATAGGAIYSANQTDNNKKVVAPAASVAITNSVLSNNTVTGNTQVGGGGVAVQSGSLTLTRSIVAHNRLVSQVQLAGGGGIYSGEALIITESVVSDNSVTAPAKQYAAIGGGIESAGTLTLSGTTIAHNTVSSRQGIAAGGGIYADWAKSANAHFSLTNCTIAANQALGARGVGGGFAADTTNNRPTRTRIDFCSIVGNVASTHAGGIDADNAQTPLSALLVLKNSLVAGNMPKTGPDMFGTFITGGYNLVQSWSGTQVKDPLKLHQTDLIIKPSVQVGIVMQLRMNGGLTPTLALQTGSPAINAIPAAACDVSTDQRGVKRPQQTSCDIGAYEYS